MRVRIAEGIYLEGSYSTCNRIKNSIDENRTIIRKDDKASDKKSKSNKR